MPHSAAYQSCELNLIDNHPRYRRWCTSWRHNWPQRSISIWFLLSNISLVKPNKKTYIFIIIIYYLLLSIL